MRTAWDSLYSSHAPAAARAMSMLLTGKTKSMLADRKGVSTDATEDYDERFYGYTSSQSVVRPHLVIKFANVLISLQ